MFIDKYIVNLIFTPYLHDGIDTVLSGNPYKLQSTGMVWPPVADTTISYNNVGNNIIL